MSLGEAMFSPKSSFTSPPSTPRKGMNTPLRDGSRKDGFEEIGSASKEKRKPDGSPFRPSLSSPMVMTPKKGGRVRNWRLDGKVGIGARRWLVKKKRTQKRKTASNRKNKRKSTKKQRTSRARKHK